MKVSPKRRPIFGGGGGDGTGGGKSWPRRTAGTKDLVTAPATPVRQFAAKGSFAGRRRFYFLARTKTTLSSHVPLSTIETWSRSATPSPLSPKAMFAVARGWFSSAMIRRLRSIGEFQGALRVSETRSVAARTVARVVGQVFPVFGRGREGVVFLSPFRISLPPSPPPLQTPKGRTSGRNNGRHYFCVRRPTDPRPPPFFPPRLPLSLVLPSRRAINL